MTDPNNGAVPPIPPPGGYSNQPPASAPNNPYPTPPAPANPYQTPSSPPSSPYGASPQYADDSAAPKTLSLIGMIAGIIGVVAFGWFAPASIAALILGYLGKSREGAPAKGFWMTAIITGYIGLLLMVFVIIGVVALVVFSSNVSPDGL